jgi:hypothetical protein
MSDINLNALLQRIERIEQFLFRNNNNYDSLDSMLEEGDAAGLVTWIVQCGAWVSTTSEFHMKD